MSYDHRITLACPESFVSDANHLAGCVGLSETDLSTFGECSWKDADGNLYSACSAQVTDRVISLLGGSLARPEWDSGKRVSMAAANRAFDILDTETQLASPDKIAAIIDIDGLQALLMMGLEQVHSA